MKTLILTAAILSAFACTKHDDKFDTDNIPTLDQAKASSSGLADGKDLVNCAARDLADAHKFTTVRIQEKDGGLILSIGKITVSGQSTSRDPWDLKSVAASTEADETQTYRVVNADGTTGDVIASYDPSAHIVQVSDPALLPFSINCDTGNFVK